MQNPQSHRIRAQRAGYLSLHTVISRIHPWKPPAHPFLPPGGQQPPQCSAPHVPAAISTTQTWPPPAVPALITAIKQPTDTWGASTPGGAEFPPGLSAAAMVWMVSPGTEGFGTSHRGLALLPPGMGTGQRQPGQVPACIWEAKMPPGWGFPSKKARSYRDVPLVGVGWRREHSERAVRVLGQKPANTHWL